MPTEFQSHSTSVEPAARTAHRLPARWRWLPAAWVALCVPASAAADPVVQLGFDGPETVWRLLDTGPRILDQRSVDDVVRAGAGSERVVILAPPGESAHLVCVINPMPVLDELQVRLWVRANRPGVRLAVRVVLPRSADGATQLPLTTILRGPASEQAGHWQQLNLSGIPHLLADEVRVLRARPGASVDPREALVDAVVLLVPGGPGETVVWTDSLEADGIVLAGAGESAGPSLVAAGVPRSISDSDPARESGWRQNIPRPTGRSASAAPAVRLQVTTLLVDEKPFVPRAIVWSGEPMQFLAERGFNMVVLPQPPTTEQSAEARRHNLWFLCTPPPPDQLAQSGLGEAVDRVLGWYFGDWLVETDLDYVRRWVELVRAHDPLTNRPIVVAPQADWPASSKLADVLVAGHPRASTMAAADFADWLETRPRLVRPGTPFWVQIPTQPGQLVQRQARSLATTAGLPLSVDDARIEALVRIACTRGCRGFLFQSSSPLNAEDERTRRRATLLELVNRQLLLMEPWLASGKVVGRVATADSSEAAAVFQVEQARLLVPLDQAKPQESPADPPGRAVDGNRPDSPRLGRVIDGGEGSLIVPGVPESNQVFLLSPAGLRPLAHSRVAGGMRVTLEKNDDSILLMTEDPRVIASFRQGAQRVGPQAARLERELAIAQSRQLIATGASMESLGWAGTDARQDVEEAGTLLERCDQQLSAGDTDRAYQLGGVARRILSLAAVRQRRSLDTPDLLFSLPLMVSYDTLPDQAAFLKSSAALSAGENQLDGGDFEDLPQLLQLGWQHVEHPVPGVAAGAELSADRPHDGGYCLRLSATAARPGGSAGRGESGLATLPGAPVRIVSPPVPVAAGQTVEISGWVRVPEPIAGSVDGLQVVDSLGGEELALAVRQTSDWQPFRMIRAASESTAVTVTFALTGLGTASVDAVTIRPLSRSPIRRLPPVVSAAGSGGYIARPSWPGPAVATRPQPLFTAPQRR